MGYSITLVITNKHVRVNTLCHKAEAKRSNNLMHAFSTMKIYVKLENITTITFIMLK